MIADVIKIAELAAKLLESPNIGHVIEGVRAAAIARGQHAAGGDTSQRTVYIVRMTSGGLTAYDNADAALAHMTALGGGAVVVVGQVQSAYVPAAPTVGP